jgi:hypothetical protein
VKPAKAKVNKAESVKPAKAKVNKAESVKPAKAKVNKGAPRAKKKAPTVNKARAGVKKVPVDVNGVPELPVRMETRTRMLPVLDEDGEQTYRGEGEERVALMETERFEFERPWHQLAAAWWGDVWRSPMAAEFVRVDVHRLWILADLVDRYWWSGGRDLAAATEIRLQERAFGLDPMSRRSLQWEVPRKSESGSEKGEGPAAAARPRGKKVDPRKMFLKVVG